jgi:SAM-dependent methyltransferase
MIPYRLRAAATALLKRWGPESLRVKLWDAEFAQGQWDIVESTANDYLYGFLERYVAGGSLLDLGCGSGNTGNELDSRAYTRYVGMDISAVALDRARLRSQANGRAVTNAYTVGDLLSYTPSGQFDVILFRESLYYVPTARVVSVIDRYARFLAENGVFIARLWDRSKHADLVNVVSSRYTIVESAPHERSAALVLVFRPRVEAAATF